MEKPDSASPSLNADGYYVVPGVLPPGLVDELTESMYSVCEDIERDIGRLRLARAGEHGVLRCMFCYVPIFYTLLELEAVRAAVDDALSPSAILHLQNGFILGDSVGDFQHTFHRDFPRLVGSRVSVNTYFALTNFTPDNGAIMVIPGSHGGGDPRATPVPLLLKAGDMLVFDSTLYHAAGANRSGHERLAVNQQFTHHWIKQQIDYVRATAARPPVGAIARQRLGYDAQVPTGIEDYYAEPRRYKGGQG